MFIYCLITFYVWATRQSFFVANSCKLNKTGLRKIDDVFKIKITWKITSGSTGYGMIGLFAAEAVMPGWVEKSSVYTPRGSRVLKQVFRTGGVLVGQQVDAL